MSEMCPTEEENNAFMRGHKAGILVVRELIVAMPPHSCTGEAKNAFFLNKRELLSSLDGLYSHDH